MDSSLLNTEDPLNLVDKIVFEVKSQGLFDRFRKECSADCDTKPAYQNLRQRVENSVANFLKDQKWTPELNRNQLRETLRGEIIASGYLEKGVERIVDQVVNPKISTVFFPHIENVICKYLGMEKLPYKTMPEFKFSGFTNGELKVETDLLPKDLEAVSPDSDDKSHQNATDFFSQLINGKSEANDENVLDESAEKLDDFESPAFEPIEGRPPSAMKKEESNDSHLSGISGLTSHDSMESNKNTNEVGEIVVTSVEEQYVDDHNATDIKVEDMDLEDEHENDEYYEEGEVIDLPDIPGETPEDIDPNLPPEITVSQVQDAIAGNAEMKIEPKEEISNPGLLEAISQDSVLSQVSSNSRLSIITHSTSPPQADMFDTAQMPKFEDGEENEANINRNLPTSFEDVKNEIKMEIKQELIEERNIEMTIQIDTVVEDEEEEGVTTIKMEFTEEQPSIQEPFVPAVIVEAKPENGTEVKMSDELKQEESELAKINKNSSSDVKEYIKNEIKAVKIEMPSPKNGDTNTTDSIFNDPDPPKSDSKDKERSRHSSSSSSHKKHDRDKDKDRYKHDSSKSRGSSSKSRYHSSSSSRDAPERSSDDRNRSSSSSKYKNSSSDRHHERSSSSKTSHRDKDRHHSSSSSSKDYKRSSSDNKSKSSSTSKSSDRHGEHYYYSKGDSKKTRSQSSDRKKSQKPEDDHASSRAKTTEKRRSTDHDSNDGSNSSGHRRGSSGNKQAANNTQSENSSTNSPISSAHDNSVVCDSAAIVPTSQPPPPNQPSSSKEITKPFNGTTAARNYKFVLNDAAFDGNIELVIGGGHRDASNPEKDSGIDSTGPEENQFAPRKKPKIASNIFEMRKIMKMRKMMSERSFRGFPDVDSKYHDNTDSQLFLDAYIEECDKLQLGHMNYDTTAYTLNCDSETSAALQKKYRCVYDLEKNTKYVSEIDEDVVPVADETPNEILFRENNQIKLKIYDDDESRELAADLCMKTGRREDGLKRRNCEDVGATSDNNNAKRLKDDNRYGDLKTARSPKTDTEIANSSDAVTSNIERKYRPKQDTKVTQCYSSEDLYKPRQMFGHRSRRRGLDSPEEPI